MRIKVTTKSDGVVYATPYANIENFFYGVVIHEGFFMTEDGRMFNQSEIVKAEEEK